MEDKTNSELQEIFTRKDGKVIELPTRTSVMIQLYKFNLGEMLANEVDVELMVSESLINPMNQQITATLNQKRAELKRRKQIVEILKRKITVDEGKEVKSDVTRN